MSKFFNNLTNRAIGQIAEIKAERFLKSKGLKLVERNYSSIYGEIDLIMLDDGVLVFIEVRFRSSEKTGNAAETVDSAKQNKIIQTAEIFLSKQNFFHNHFIRFDVVSFDGLKQKTNWIQSAFECN